MVRRRPTCVVLWSLACLALLAAVRTPSSAAAQYAGGELSGELRVWVHLADRGRQAAFRAFERRHPGLRIITSPYLGGQDAQRLMTAIAGGDPPDLLLQDRFTIGEWAARGAFMDLSDLLAAQDPADPETIRAEDFYNASWSEAVYEGNAYGVPLNTDARGLFYREDLLEEAGLTDAGGEAKPPADWDELKRYATRLTVTPEGRTLAEARAAGDPNPPLARLGFASNFGNAWLYTYAFQNGGDFLSPDGATVTLSDPANVEALGYMADLYEVGGGVGRVDAFVTAASGPEMDPFATGRLAMKIDGNWDLNAIARYHPNLRFGVAPPPAPAGRPSVTWAGGFAYVIPATAANTAAAFELTRFLLSDEGWRLQHAVNARYARSRGEGYVPDLAAQPAVNAWLAEELVANDPNLPPRVRAAFPVFSGLMQSARFRPVTPVGQLLWDEQVRAIDQATRGGVDPAVALTASGRRVQTKLDRLLNPPPARPVRAWQVAGIVLLGSVLAGLGAWLFSVRERRSGRVGKRHDAAETRAAWFFVSPWLVGFAVLTAGPVAASVLYSFCRYDVLHPAEWVGLENYRRLLFDDPLFWLSLANTGYMLLGVPLGMAVGLGIALLLNTEVRGMKVYRTVFYLPAIVPLVASSILWLWVLNPTNGLINAGLYALGVDHPPLWLASPSWGLGSKAAILLMGLWGAGGSMIIWLAGLKGISRSLYEAAQIDGAGPLRCFFAITLPMLTPYVFFNLVMGVIGTMQIFTQAFIMTSGGPADSTVFYAYHLFNAAFRYFEMGYASALAWVLMLMILALTGFQLWTSKRWVHYETET